MSVWNCSSSVEDAVERVLNHYGHDTHISSISLRERDALGTAQCPKSRVGSDLFRETSSNCPNCWLQPQSHCICSKCIPISHKPSKLNRIFLLMHYKELMIKVDNTAKLLWAHFPETILAVSGISSKLPFSRVWPRAPSDNAGFALQKMCCTLSDRLCQDICRNNGTRISL
jgi:hypothetical protein